MLWCDDIAANSSDGRYCGDVVPVVTVSMWQHGQLIIKQSCFLLPSHIYAIVFNVPSTFWKK